MKKLIHDFTVVSNIRLNNSYFILELLAPQPLPLMEPGQFAEVLVPGCKDVFLRRPLAIHDVNIHENTIRLLIMIVGKGTLALSQLRAGELLNLVYPLGTGFRLPENGDVLLVGGGAGTAPLLFLAHSLFDYGFVPSIVIGGKSYGDILETRSFEQYCNVYTITEDGSQGEKGLITDHTIFSSVPFPFHTIYACGTTNMLKAISNLSGQLKVACQVSLDNTMACGIGACLCCVVNTTTGYRLACTDGPVFDASDLPGWQNATTQSGL